MDKLTLLLEKQEQPVKLLNFPSVRQSNSDRCGIDAVQGVLQYYGEDYREDELILSLRNTKTFVADNRGSASVDNIVNLFKDKGYKIDKREMNVNDLINYLDKDIPVIILIQAWGDTSDYSDEWLHGHYVTAIGYTKNKILFSDPSSFNTTFARYDDLMDRWHDRDDDEEYNNLGIAVYGKRPIYDKNKWIEIG